MKKKVILLIIPILTALYFQTAGQAKSDPGHLAEEFTNPPKEAWPKTYWWWLHGNIDTMRIREEIAQMDKMGLSGFDIFDIGSYRNDTIITKHNIPFLGPAFLQALAVAFDEAKKRDMSVGMSVASSWNAGGSWVTPEYAAKSIYFSRTSYTGKSMKLPFPKLVMNQKKGKIQLAADAKTVDIELDENGRPAFYYDVVILAIPTIAENSLVDPDDIIDVTRYFDPKTEILKWQHEGSYNIYRYVCTNSGEKLKLPSISSDGPIIDHFSAEATTFHFNYIIDRLKSILGENLGETSLRHLYLASYEVVGHVWTQELPEKFRQLSGFDIYPYLPLLFEEEIYAPEIAERVMKFYQLTLSELMINNFYRKAGEIAHNNGLLINSESGGPGFPLHNVPVEPLKSLGTMDLPRGEFWINHDRFNDEGIDILRMVKEVSSASHIYGRGIVEQEAFTSFKHWQEGPFEMKPYGDRAFCKGMNKVVVHGSSHNPASVGVPGNVYAAGTHFNDRRIWWPKVKPFNAYLARVSHILQQTDFVADVLYYYGDAVPNYASHKNGRFTVGPGYDYEVINTEIIKQIEFDDGNFVLPTGARFRLLVLEKEDKIDVEVFHKIKQLTGEGGIILSEKPNGFYYSISPLYKEYNLNDIEDLWTVYDRTSHDLQHPSGKIYAGIDPAKALSQMGIEKDLSYDGEDLSLLDYIHHENQDYSFYFIRNSSDQWVTKECTFRQNTSGQLWHPVDARIVDIPVAHRSSSHITIPLSFAPYEAYFVVFGNDNGEKYNQVLSPQGVPALISYTEDGVLAFQNEQLILTSQGIDQPISNPQRSIPIDGAWELFFPEGWHAPDRTIVPELKSWTEFEDPGIKYFSGIARYVKTFQHDIHSIHGDDYRIYLDLGELSNVAEVWLNGQNLGIQWAAPYRMDVTDLLKPGNNLLEIEVANTWSNRLKGDAVLGTDLTYTNVTTTDINGLNKIDVPWKDVPLLQSGLLGPVRLIVLKPIR